MADSVPNPSDRTARLITRVAPAATVSDLVDQHVELVAARWTPDIEIAVALAATLLLRLDRFAPAVHVIVPAGRNRRVPRLADGQLAEALADEHTGFDSVNRLTTTPASTPVVRLIFGDQGDGITVDCAGWRVSVGMPLGGSPGNDLAAAFAGVLASAEVLQALLEPFIPRLRHFRGTASLWDPAVPHADGPQLDGAVDLDGTLFVACGGVASATFWALGLLELQGAPLLIDPDVIDDDATNLNRHLTASYGDLGKSKAALGAALLSAAGANPLHRRERWSTLESRYDTVVLSPDDDAVRRDVQLAMPKFILNGGTNDDGMYIVSSHDFLNDACLACIARSDLQDRSPVAAAARRLGLAEANLAPYMNSDEPLPAAVLARATGLTTAERASLANVSGRNVVEHLCGTVRATPGGVAVSAPMLSAAPGVMLASELVRLRLGHSRPPSVTMASILRGPHDQWTFTRRKVPACVCSDMPYRSHFAEKWGVL